MAGIGIILTRAIISDGADRLRMGFSSFGEQGDSGMRLRRQPGDVERALGGIASTAEVRAVAEKVTPAQFEWLLERLGRVVHLRTPDGFSAEVTIARVIRNQDYRKSDTLAWGVNITFYIVTRN